MTIRPLRCDEIASIVHLVVVNVTPGSDRPRTTDFLRYAPARPPSRIQVLVERRVVLSCPGNGVIHAKRYRITTLAKSLDGGDALENESS